MDKGTPPSLFVNDGSFMERFRQLQQEDKKKSASELIRPVTIESATLTPNSTVGKNSSATRKTTTGSSTGKLAFSLKTKSKLATPAIKLGEDEDEDEADDGNVSGDGPTKRIKLERSDDHHRSSGNVGNHRVLYIVFTC